MNRLIIAAFGAAAFLTGPALAGTPVNWCYEDKEGPPYLIGNGKDLATPNPGITVEHLQMVAAKLDLQVTFIRTPWTRCLELLKDGKVDGVFPGSFKKERMEMGAFPMADAEKPDTKLKLNDIAYGLYKLKDSPVGVEGGKPTNVTGKIAGPLGYSIVKDLKDQGFEVDEAQNTETIFKLIKAGRVAAGALQPPAANAILKARGAEYEGIVEVQPPLVVKPYYLLISHQFKAANGDLTQKIWATIAEVRDAELAKLEAKYAQ